MALRPTASDAPPRPHSPTQPATPHGAPHGNENRREPDTPPAPVSITGLQCRYGSFEAVRGVDLEVRPGEIVALLGTNGAGKTTTLAAVLGERAADAGEVRVLGLDPATSRRTIAPRLGVVFQQAGLPDALTAREAVALWRRLQATTAPSAPATDRLLDQVGLLPRSSTSVGSLSGGERRRLELALAISGDPDLVVLDEPTTGMDPSSRRTTWALIRRLRDEGRSVLLTTHYLEEAEALSDRIAIMHHGRIAAAGTLPDLVAAHPSTLEATLERSADASRLLTSAGVGGDARTTPAAPDGRTRLSVATFRLQDDLHRLLNAAHELGLTLDELRATPASLDTAFHAIATDTEDPR
jgi:ABC-2 type transport system ATP-binding protein